MCLFVCVCQNRKKNWIIGEIRSPNYPKSVSEAEERSLFAKKVEMQNCSRDKIAYTKPSREYKLLKQEPSKSSTSKMKEKTISK